MGLHIGDSAAENLMMMIELFQPNHLEDTQCNICVLHYDLKCQFRSFQHTFKICHRQLYGSLILPEKKRKKKTII